MSLTRYLPTPSDRMGILWTLLQIEDAIILEYGTAGTTAYAMKTFGMMDFTIHNRLFTTGLDENSIVMGDTTKLEEKIKSLDKKYTPKVIFVMASSVSSVTGSDVKGVCNYLQDEVNAKIITFTQGGWGGDFSSGIQSCLTDLVSILATSAKPVENYYNLLGVSSIATHANANTADIKTWMNQNFGLEPNAVLSLHTNLTQIEQMSRAKVNLVISYEGLTAAKILKERFGTPYVYGLPLGQNATQNWLADIADAIGLSTSPNKISSLSTPKSTFTKCRKIAVYASFDELLAFKKLATELDLEIEFLLCTHKINKIKDRPSDITYLKDEKSKIQLFSQLTDTLIIGDNTFINHANNTNQKIQATELKQFLSL